MLPPHHLHHDRLYPQTGSPKRPALQFLPLFWEGGVTTTEKEYGEHLYSGWKDTSSPPPSWSKAGIQKTYQVRKKGFGRQQQSSGHSQLCSLGRPGSHPGAPRSADRVPGRAPSGASTCRESPLALRASLRAPPPGPGPPRAAGLTVPAPGPRPPGPRPRPAPRPLRWRLRPRGDARLEPFPDGSRALGRGRRVWAERRDAAPETLPGLEAVGEGRPAPGGRRAPRSERAGRAEALIPLGLRAPRSSAHPLGPSREKVQTAGHPPVAWAACLSELLNCSVIERC